MSYFDLWYFVVVKLPVKMQFISADLNEAFAVHSSLFKLMEKAWAMDMDYLNNPYYQIIHADFESVNATFDKRKKQSDAIRNALKYYETHGIK